MRRNCIPEPSLRVLYKENWPNTSILRNIDSGEQNKFHLSNGHLICKSFNSQLAKTPIVYISPWRFIPRTASEQSSLLKGQEYRTDTSARDVAVTSGGKATNCFTTAELSRSNRIGPNCRPQADHHGVSELRIG